MFGNKLRSWMDAVRPRKKQQRKEKQKSGSTSNGKICTTLKPAKPYSSQNEVLEDIEHKSGRTIGNHAPRYSGTNLSSPESAYSTGYSTDGTSPGAPPEYYINIRTGTKYFPSATPEKDNRPSAHTTNISCFKENSEPLSKSKVSPRHNKSPKVDRMSTVAVRLNENSTTVSMSQDFENYKNQPTRASVTFQNNLNPMNGISPRVTEVVVNSGITSPRQRNRIRTNPWLPGNNLSPCASSVGLHIRQDNVKQPVPNSPVPMHCLSLCSSPSKKPVPRMNESTSSSCSSLSAASLHWDTNLIGPNSGSEEDDDCTLNEMMGKYDESYIYEKETDILSDSDPTDCETDIDTGQDGGDEDEPLEREFDFIDNGSYLEFNMKDDKNTGHCTYYNFEVQRRSSRRRMSRKFKQESQQSKQNRRRSTSAKQKPKYEQKSYSFTQIDGSKSAGATPVSARRTKYPVSKLVLEDHLKKRSNSVSFSRTAVNTFDQRDKEADKKYRELIVEAEHILMSMKHGGLSPRRLPGPANKRVELLRTESTKPDIFNKNRLIEDVTNMHLTKIPSNCTNSRYSPKRNHITNFINSNSPIHARREAERPIDIRSTALNLRKEENTHHITPVVPNSPSIRKKYHSKSEVRRSPKYRKKISKTLSLRNNDVSSSDSDQDQKCQQRLPIRNAEQNGFVCPQSEPVKRKVYNHHSKTVAFNLNYESVYDLEHRNSTENLRQQVLLNTIANLKKSLEDQSASLKQVYSSSQDVQL